MERANKETRRGMGCKEVNGHGAISSFLNTPTCEYRCVGDEPVLPFPYHQLIHQKPYGMLGQKRIKVEEKRTAVASASIQGITEHSKYVQPWTRTICICSYATYGSSLIFKFMHLSAALMRALIQIIRSARRRSRIKPEQDAWFKSKRRRY